MRGGSFLDGESKRDMNLNNAKTNRFKSATEEEWEIAVLKSLKGKELNTLQTKTFENIILKPLYQDEGKKDEVPGIAPYTRGIYKNGYQHQSLKICQVASGTNLKETILTALENGQNTLSFNPTSLTHDDLLDLLNDLPIESYPLFVQADERQEFMMEKLHEVESFTAQGAVVRDLITEWAEKGAMPAKETAVLSHWFQAIKEWKHRFPEIKTILVNSKPYHEAGADAVKELAYGLAIGSHYVAEGMQQGLTSSEIAEKMIFSFSIDSVFFMQIAKLRAARKLWYAIGKAYGQDNSFKMNIHAQTSRRNKTSFDRHVNLLRTTNEALAAVIGNCQYLTIDPFDELLNEKSSLGKRLARNIPHILKEESMLMSTVDPGGGSYYLETLTDELCQQAWNLFLEIEKKGGILPELKKGNLQRELANQAKMRLSAAAIRKERIVGINVYANPKESRPNMVQAFKLTPTIQKGEKEIEQLQPIRMALEFEAIRSMNLTWGNEEEKKQRIVLIGIGSISQSKPYLDFAKELLAAGGLRYKEITEITESEELRKVIQEGQAGYILICGDEKHLNPPLPTIQMDGSVPIYTVGNFESAIKAFNWKKIDRHTHMIDLLTILSSAQEVNV